MTFEAGSFACAASFCISPLMLMMVRLSWISTNRSFFRARLSSLALSSSSSNCKLSRSISRSRWTMRRVRSSPNRASTESLGMHTINNWLEINQTHSIYGTEYKLHCGVHPLFVVQWSIRYFAVWFGRRQLWWRRRITAEKFALAGVYAHVVAATDNE